MPQIRNLVAHDPDHQHNCDLIDITSYEMKEVVLPTFKKKKNVRAIQVTVHGRNLKAVAQPLMVFVGDQMLKFMRIAPDEKSVEGILLNEPKPGDSIVVQLGDQDAARHPQPVDAKAIKRARNVALLPYVVQ